ncbi:MAG TPA: hypothetical protein VFJ65_02380 [Solirubrobacterales bacterium]|nr:hypothetical protein [Solirubrobacterales bacterium]
MTLPLAHVGHYLWVLYLVPVVIVVAGIVRSSILARRRQDEEADGHSTD